MTDINTLDYTQNTIENVCQNLYEELLTSGSSLLYSDIENAAIAATKDYVTWNGELRALTRQHVENKVDSSAIMALLVNGSSVLHIDEWSIIKPVVKAHCDIIQASRMEGAQGLGVQPSGMGASETKQIYHEAVLQMQKEAFNCNPFTVELGGTYQDSAAPPTLDTLDGFTIGQRWGWM